MQFFFLFILCFLCFELSAAEVKPGDIFELKDGQVAIVKRLLGDYNFKSYRTPKEIKKNRAMKVRFEFMIEGDPRTHVGVMYQGFTLLDPRNVIRFQRIEDNLNFIYQQKKQNLDLRFHDSEFYKNVAFKGEVVQIISSPERHQTLLDVLKNRPFLKSNQFDWEMNLVLAYEVYQQLKPTFEAIWKGGKVYLDLKPSNIIITPEGTLLLIDFESMRPFGKIEGPIIGMPYFSPPEAFDDKSQEFLRSYQTHPSYDVYSFGMIFREFFSYGRINDIPIDQGLLIYAQKAQASAREMNYFINSFTNPNPSLRNTGSASGLYLPEMPMMAKFANKQGFDGRQSMTKWLRQNNLTNCAQKRKLNLSDQVEKTTVDQ